MIATGESHSVREVLEVAFGAVGLDWKNHVEIDPRYFRPTEVDHLRGDARKARRKLGWKPKVTFQELITMMVRADEEDVRASLAGGPRERNRARAQRENPAIATADSADFRPRGSRWR